MRSILVLVALSPRAAAVAAEARRLAESLYAELTVLHVGSDLPTTRRQLMTALRAAGLPEDIPIIVRAGRLEDVIERLVRERGYDLVVAGALEREGLLRYYVIGSVARRVARTAPCSVLLLTQPDITPRRFRRIACSINYDAPSRSMLTMILDIARREGAEVVHVVNEYELPAFNLAMGDTMDARRADESRRHVQSTEMLRLASFLDEVRAEGVSIRPACIPGKHGAETVRFAQGEHVDLLCFPAGGSPLTFWDKFFQHGVEVALQRLPCNVLLYRSRSGAGV